MMFRALRHWIQNHPARAGTLAGWYQQGCGALAALIAVPLVIRNLGSTDAGIWFSFQSVLAIINLTDFGLSFVVSRQVAYSLKAKGEGCEIGPDFLLMRTGWAGVSDVYEVSRRMFRWVSFAGLILLIILYQIVLPLGKLIPIRNAETTGAWYLLGAATLLSLQAKPHQALLDGLAKVYLTRFLAGTYQLIAGFGAVGVLVLGGKLAEMAAVVSAASLLNYAVIRWLVRVETVARLPRAKRLSPGVFTHFLRVSVPMGILNLSAFCVSSVQVPLIGSLLGPQVVPAFYLAQRIGQMLNQAVIQLVHPQLPLFTQELAGGQIREARNRMIRTIVWVTSLAVAANGVFWYFSPFIVDLWVGPSRYVPANVLLLMSIDYLVLSAAVVWGFFVLASGCNPFVFSTMISGMLNIMLCTWILPIQGLIGVPMATLVAGLFTNYWFNFWKGGQLLRRLSLSTAPVAGTAAL